MGTFKKDTLEIMGEEVEVEISEEYFYETDEDGNRRLVEPLDKK